MNLPEDLKSYQASNEDWMEHIEILLWIGIAIAAATLVVVLLHLGGPG